MGIFKSAGGSFLKYGEKIVNKTEDYTKIAKLKIDIKRLEEEIEKCYIKAGRTAVSEYKKGIASMTLSDIKEVVDKIENSNALIESKRMDIEELKRKSSVQEEEVKDN